MNKLKELAAEGNINPRYITTKKILENYHDIVAARKNMHTWGEIDRDFVRSFRAAFVAA